MTKLITILLTLALLLTPAGASAATWTDDDADMLARMMYGECRGVESDMERAATAWVVLNRVDADGYGDTIKAVVTAKKQFVGYKASNPVWPELRELAIDVLERWEREKDGETDVGRVIPADYYWFTGDGKRNHFRNGFKTKKRWDWSLTNPYKD
jgi:hypothetical protein